MEEIGGNKNFASTVNLITAVTFLLQQFINSKFQFTINFILWNKKVKSWFNVLVHTFCYGVVTISFEPQLYVIYFHFKTH